MNNILKLCIIALVIGFVVLAGFWAQVSYSQFTREKLAPGKKYKIGSREYQIPADCQVIGDAYILKTPFIERVRELFRRTSGFLNANSIAWRLSGGTLLGAVRNGTLPIPFDDDVDLHIMWADQPKLFQLLGTDFSSYGIEPILLHHGSVAEANVLTSAVRFRLRSHRAPVLDIFFNKQIGQKLLKIDTWKEGKFTFAEKETWDISDVFPLRNVIIDQLPVTIPNKPFPVLLQQYGSGFMNKIIARPVMLSHTFPQKLLFFFYEKGGLFVPSKRLLEFILKSKMSLIGF